MATDSGTTPGGGGQGGFGNGKLAAVIGVVLPLCTYVYSEQQKDIQHRQEIVAEKQRQQRLDDEKQRQEDETARERDRVQALQILDEYRDRRFPYLADSRAISPFDDAKACEFLVSEIGLTQWGLVGNQTFDVLFGLLTSKLKSSSEQIMCYCGGDVGRLVLSLDTINSGPSVSNISKDRISYFISNINNKLNKCEDNGTETASIISSHISLPASISNLPQNSEEIKEILDKLSPRPRIYIQIRAESDLNNAKCLQEKLRSLGYSVPGIENVGGKSSDMEQRLRYVDTPTTAISDGSNERALADAAAAHITAAAKACNVASLAPPSPPLVPVALKYREGKTRPHHLELWLPTPQ